MKAKITIQKEVDIHLMQVNAKVRYWEDASVDGKEDTDGDLMPCRNGDNWSPQIEVDTGIIKNWTQGKEANVHYKVCDCCSWELQDTEGNVLKSDDDYVPDVLSPGGKGYGDSIIMKITDQGQIVSWDKNHIYKLID